MVLLRWARIEPQFLHSRPIAPRAPHATSRWQQPPGRPRTAASRSGIASELPPARLSANAQDSCAAEQRMINDEVIDMMPCVASSPRCVRAVEDGVGRPFHPRVASPLTKTQTAAQHRSPHNAASILSGRGAARRPASHEPKGMRADARLRARRPSARCGGSGRGLGVDRPL